MFDFNSNPSDADEISDTILQLRKTIAETQTRIQSLETVEGAVEVLKARGATVLIEPPNPGCYSGQLIVTLVGYQRPKSLPNIDPIVQMFFDRLKERVGSDLRDEDSSCLESANRRFQKAATWIRTHDNNRRLLNLNPVNEHVLMFKYLTATERGPVHFLIKIERQSQENWTETAIQPEGVEWQSVTALEF